MPSRFYTALLWVVLIGLAGLLVYGLIEARIFDQSIWSPVGLRRLERFTAGFAVITGLIGLVARRFLVPLFTVTAVGFTALEVGWGPVLAVLLFLLSSAVLGRTLLATDSLLALLVGIAIWQSLVMLAVVAPINYPFVYLIALALPLLLRPGLTIAVARACLFVLRPAWRPLPEYLALSLVLYLAAAYLLTALMPEVSADGLGVHMAIPAFVANHHYWHFDPTRSTWALMPMAADWTYTITYMLGGEFAAHLTNLAMWMIVAALLYQAVRVSLAPAPSFLLTAALLSTPTAQFVTGSLMTENFLTAMLFASLIALDRFRTTGAARYVLAGCVLAATAVATKFGSIAFLIPLLVIAAFIGRRRRIPARYAAAAAALFIALATPPYLTAYWKTGNPIFPFQNHIFGSPLYEAREPLIDARYLMPLKWDTLYDLAFHSDRYMEAQRGALGYHYFLFLPLCALVYSARWPWLARVSLPLALLAIWFLTRTQFNLRYLYPAFPWIMAAIGVSWAVCRERSRVLFHALVAACVATIALNVSCLATSSWFHKDFCMTPFKPQRRDAHIEFAAPARRLVAYMNEHHGGQSVLFIGHTAIAELRGRAYLAGWHNYLFNLALKQDRTPENALRVLGENRIRFLIVPVQENEYGEEEQHVRELVKRWTVEEHRGGRYRIVRLLE
jgi:hypothetical protein